MKYPHLIPLVPGMLLSLALAGTGSAWAVPTTFDSNSDGDWRGPPPPWTIVSGGADHDYPVAGDTARILGYSLVLSHDEAVAFLDFRGDVLSLNGNELTVSTGGSWSDGNVVGGGVLHLQGGSLLIAPNASARLGSTLWIEGTATHTGTIDLQLTDGGVVDIGPTGVLELQASASLVRDAAAITAPGITNRGRLLKTGAGTSLIGGSMGISMPGTLEVHAGQLQLDAEVAEIQEGDLTAGTWKVFTNATLELGAQSISTNSSAILLEGVGANFNSLAGLRVNRGTFELQNGASFLTSSALENSGHLKVGIETTLTVRGDLTQSSAGQISGVGSMVAVIANQGLISPGNSVGILRLNDHVTLLPESRIRIELGGLAVGTDFDQLQVSGSIDLGGSLEITLTNDFTPQLGDRFRILTYTSHTGTFASISGLELSPDLILFPSYKEDGLELVAIPPHLSLLHPIVEDGFFSFSLETVAGITYVVEATSTLSPPDWQVFAEIIGDGSTQVVTDFGDSPEWYYRVRLE